MDPLEKSRQREKQVAARLHLAITRLESAQQERIRAIAAAQSAGLSIRKIAAATGLSPSRIHQLLKNHEASEIPAWLSQLRELLQDSEEVSFKESANSPLPARLMAEVEVLYWCIDWLEYLERGEDVVVNLRPDIDFKTELVHFDRPRVLRVLSMIAADLKELTHC